MRAVSRTGIAVLVVAAAVLLFGGTCVAKYNSLVKLDQAVDAQWAQVENVYQRRADLVPNLVETVKGAARFERTEGCWEGDGRIYFDCTTGGPAGMGQIWELDPKSRQLRLILQPDDPAVLFHPDNLTVAPTGDLFICEDTGGNPVPQIRALTPEGLIYDFARVGRGGRPDGTNLSEFCGVCFTPVPSLRRRMAPSPRSASLTRKLLACG